MNGTAATYINSASNIGLSDNISAAGFKGEGYFFVCLYECIGCLIKRTGDF